MYVFFLTYVLKNLFRCVYGLHISHVHNEMLLYLLLKKCVIIIIYGTTYIAYSSAQKNLRGGENVPKMEMFTGR